jgi:NAD(P)-dependent dehydrogenase (short-subunit alcohol dehydrogenase family)
MSLAKLDNKIILVTGANTGVGEHTARLCIAQGAKVAVHGRRPDAVQKIVDELGPNAHGVIGSLETAEDPAKVVEQTVAHFGRLDGVVNNAARTTRSHFEKTDVAFFDNMMATNVRAPFLIIQAALPYLKEAQGSVVNIGSINALGGERMLAPYSISKGALLTLSKHLANLYDRDSIRFTHINLGWVLTENEYDLKISDGFPEGWQHDVPKMMVPSGKMSSPQEVAKVIAFWLSDDSKPWNGTVFELEQYPFKGRIPSLDADFLDGKI